ncbi:MAG: ATP-binding protein, partial [Pseudonocardia sp.]
MDNRGPYVRDGLLHRPDGPPLPVGGFGWQRWLDGPAVPTLRIEDTDPPCSARRERRGASGFWYAYRRCDGALRKAYLGRAEDVTAERLHAAADELGSGRAEVARSAAVAGIRALLRRHRLVTLVGTGGIGKSSLARQVAGADPWLVELAPVADPAVVPALVRAGLGVPEQPGHTAVETIAGLVGGGRRLLVVDNCEHLADAVAALVADLLDACPRLAVLATSRVGLGLAAECALPVPVMTVPAAAAPAAALLATESGRLFRMRARVADPAFIVTEAVAAAVGRICRAVDGIPLALELAASRLRVFTVDELAERLRDVHATLGSSPDPRQHTLRATLDWSHAQLDERERALLARLSVFTGSWVLDTAEAVCVGVGLDRADIADVLGCLLDHALVQRTADGRFRLLEPVRQYAAGRLRERGEEDAVRDRHARDRLAFAEGVASVGWYARTGAGLARLRHEEEDFWVACRRLVARGRIGDALQIARMVAFHGTFTVGAVETQRRLVELLDHAAAADEPPPLGAALATAGTLATENGDWEWAQPVLERALALAHACGDRVVAAETLFGLCLIHYYRRDLGTALALAVEGASLSDTPGLEGIACYLYAIQARIDQACGRPAGPAAERAVELGRSTGQTAGTALAEVALAFDAWEQGDAQRARLLADRAYGTAGVSATVQALARVVCCWVALGAGDPATAAGHVSDAVGLTRRRLGDARLVLPLEAAAQVAAATGEPASALRLAGVAATLRDRCDHPPTPLERRQLDRWTDRATAVLG